LIVVRANACADAAVFINVVRVVDDAIVATKVVNKVTSHTRASANITVRVLNWW
jgi:hypothetical protein